MIVDIHTDNIPHCKCQQVYCHGIVHAVSIRLIKHTHTKSCTYTDFVTFLLCIKQMYLLLKLSRNSKSQTPFYSVGQMNLNELFYRDGSLKNETPHVIPKHRNIYKAFFEHSFFEHSSLVNNCFHCTASKRTAGTFY